MSRASRVLFYFCIFILCSVLLDMGVYMFSNVEKLPLEALVHRAYAAAFLYIIDFPISSRLKTLVLQVVSLSVLISSYETPVKSLSLDALKDVLGSVLLKSGILLAKFVTFILIEDQFSGAR